MKIGNIKQHISQDPSLLPKITNTTDCFEFLLDEEMKVLLPQKRFSLVINKLYKFNKRIKH